MTNNLYRFSLCVLLPCMILLSACSSVEKHPGASGASYVQKSQRQRRLELPPDLTRPTQDERFVVPKVDEARRVPLQSVGHVKIERNDVGRSYLTLQVESIGKLWQQLRQFWIAQGFELAKDQPELGIMETNWLENRAHIQSDGLRSLIGKIGLDSVLSNGQRDSYRTRIERYADHVEIFITHRGIEEQYTDSKKDQTAWTPRPYDQELEIEFLKRLMLSLQKP